MADWIINKLEDPHYAYALDYLPGGGRYSEVADDNKRIQEIIPIAYLVKSPEGRNRDGHSYLEVWYYDPNGLNSRGRRQAYRALTWQSETGEPIHSVDNRLLEKLMEMDSEKWPLERRRRKLEELRGQQEKKVQEGMDASQKEFMERVEEEGSRKRHKKGFSKQFIVTDNLTRE